MDIENMLTDDDFKSGFEAELVPAGKYLVKCIKGNPRIKVSKTGNRYLNLRLAAVETEGGERVNSKIIYHIVPIEGTNKKGQRNAAMFAGFFSALGLDKDAVRELYTELLTSAPTAESIGDDTEVQLTLRGDKFDLTGRTLMASVKEDEYQGKTKNVIGSVWEPKAK